MSPGQTNHDNTSSDGYDTIPEAHKQFPGLASLLHFVWLRKWAVVAVWLLLAIPAGILLSIFDLPKSYIAATVLRFPAVVGAQTNVMRDVAITQGESIISIFNSFQVLEGTVRKLDLRMRIVTPRVFRRDAFKSIRYSETLGPGLYTVHPLDDRRVKLTYLPGDGNSEYALFEGPLIEGRLSVPGLEITLAPSFFVASKGKAVALELAGMEETITALRKAMSTRVLGSSNFEVRLKDRDPYLVADILNALRDQFLEVYYGTTEVQDVGILAQMEKDLDLAKQRLEKSQDDVSKYYAAHPELVSQAAPNEGDNLTFLESRQQIEMLQQRKNRVQVAMAAKDAAATGDKRYFWASELLQAMSEAGEPKANILRASLSELNNRQAGYRATLGPEHPKFLEVEKEKEDLYRQAEETEAELLRRLDKELGEWKVKAARSAPSNAPRVPVKVQLELERLNSVNQNNQQIYDRLLESYNRAKLVTGSEFFKVTVVDPARPALYEPPSFKTRVLFAAAAVFLLMLLVPGAFLAWPLLFIKIRTKDDVQRLMGTRLLGSISWRKPAKRKAAGKPKKGEKGAAAEAPGVDPLLLFQGSGYTLEDVEAFRIIREEAENAFRNPKRPGRFCLMITSCNPGEGKSNCASNLAMTFARKGKRTLLVDADFRLGRIHKIFNVNVATGLDEILGQEDFNLNQLLEASSMAFQGTAQRNLVLAPRKNPDPNAGELVSSDRFKAFIAMAREQFEVVIIDTPPVLITPEPLSLAEITDGVVFVCRSGVTSASDAREALALLQERRVGVATVLNGVYDTIFHQSHYRKYSYYYHGHAKPADRIEA